MSDRTTNNSSSKIGLIQGGVQRERLKRSLEWKERYQLRSTMTDKRGGNENYNGLVVAKQKNFSKKNTPALILPNLAEIKIFSGKNTSSCAVTRFHTLRVGSMYSPVALWLAHLLQLTTVLTSWHSNINGKTNQNKQKQRHKPQSPFRWFLLFFIIYIFLLAGV